MNNRYAPTIAPTIFKSDLSAFIKHHAARDCDKIGEYESVRWDRGRVLYFNTKNNVLKPNNCEATLDVQKFLKIKASNIPVIIPELTSKQRYAAINKRKKALQVQQKQAGEKKAVPGTAPPPRPSSHNPTLLGISEDIGFQISVINSYGLTLEHTKTLLRMIHKATNIPEELFYSQVKKVVA